MVMKLSEIDAALIRYADTLSPAQISFKIEGILSPEQVMARIGQLVDTPDWLSSARQDQLVTLKMRQLVVELEEMPRTPRNAEILIRSLEALGHRLDQRSAATQQDLSTLYAFQGAVMLDAIQSAIGHLKESVTALTDLSQDEWDTLLSQALRHAQMEISKHEEHPDESLLQLEQPSNQP